MPVIPPQELAMMVIDGIKTTAEGRSKLWPTTRARGEAIDLARNGLIQSAIDFRRMGDTNTATQIEAHLLQIMDIK